MNSLYDLDITEKMPDVQLIHGDCLEVIKEIPPGIVSAVISDPPYGINFVKGPWGREVDGRKSLRRGTEPIIGDDKPFDPAPFLERWPCVFFGADHFSHRLPPGGSWHVWDKRAYSTIEDSFADMEFVWSSVPHKSVIIEHLWKGVQQASEKGLPKYHVSQKPVRVMARLLEMFTEPGDLILDPFAGSYSTLLACLKTGRRGIGIEIDARYMPVGRRRIDAARTPLFA